MFIHPLFPQDSISSTLGQRPLSSKVVATFFHVFAGGAFHHKTRANPGVTMPASVVVERLSPLSRPA
jgi:hypothetical protein